MASTQISAACMDGHMPLLAPPGGLGDHLADQRASGDNDDLVNNELETACIRGTGKAASRGHTAALGYGTRIVDTVKRNKPAVRGCLVENVVASVGLLPTAALVCPLGPSFVLFRLPTLPSPAQAPERGAPSLTGNSSQVAVASLVALLCLTLRPSGDCLPWCLAAMPLACILASFWDASVWGGLRLLLPVPFIHQV